MSRIKESLVFKNDEERMEWFHSLTPDEQAEVAKEAGEIVDKFIEAFRPVAEALGTVFGLLFDLLCKNVSEIGDEFAVAQANNACTGQLAGAGKADGESTPSANCQ